MYTIESVNCFHYWFNIIERQPKKALISLNNGQIDRPIRHRGKPILWLVELKLLTEEEQYREAFNTPSVTCQTQRQKLNLVFLFFFLNLICKSNCFWAKMLWFESFEPGKENHINGFRSQSWTRISGAYIAADFKIGLEKSRVLLT